MPMKLMMLVLPRAPMHPKAYHIKMVCFCLLLQLLQQATRPFFQTPMKQAKLLRSLLPRRQAHEVHARRSNPTVCFACRQKVHLETWTSASFCVAARVVVRQLAIAYLNYIDSGCDCSNAAGFAAGR